MSVPGAELVGSGEPDLSQVVDGVTAVSSHPMEQLSGLSEATPILELSSAASQDPTARKRKAGEEGEDFEAEDHVKRLAGSQDSELAIAERIQQGVETPQTPLSTSGEIKRKRGRPKLLTATPQPANESDETPKDPGTLDLMRKKAIEKKQAQITAATASRDRDVIQMVALSIGANLLDLDPNSAQMRSALEQYNESHTLSSSSADLSLDSPSATAVPAARKSGDKIRITLPKAGMKSSAAGGGATVTIKLPPASTGSAVSPSASGSLLSSSGQFALAPPPLSEVP